MLTLPTEILMFPQNLVHHILNGGVRNSSWRNRSSNYNCYIFTFTSNSI